MFILVILSTIRIPYVIEHLKALEIQKHPNLHEIWASCILLILIVPTVTLYFLSISRIRYYEANIAADVVFYYVTVQFFLVTSFFINFIVSRWYDRCQLELSSCIKVCSFNCPYNTLKASRLLTYIIVGLVFNALHLLIPCGYAIVLAIVASPFHAMPVLLLYLSCIYVFVITVSDSLKKKKRICVIIVLVVNVILSILLILSYFIMVTLIGEYSRDEGLFSVVGGLLPVSLNILLGYFIREIVNMLFSRVNTD